MLFHYNGHGVPRPTANGEVWVFNKSYTQYIPLSIYDLQARPARPAGVRTGARRRAATRIGMQHRAACLPWCSATDALHACAAGLGAVPSRVQERARRCTRPAAHRPRYLWASGPKAVEL